MTAWVFILFFYSCGIEQKVCKAVANKFNGLQKGLFSPHEFTVPEETTFLF